MCVLFSVRQHVDCSVDYADRTTCVNTGTWYCINAPPRRCIPDYKHRASRTCARALCPMHILHHGRLPQTSGRNRKAYGSMTVSGTCMDVGPGVSKQNSFVYNNPCVLMSSAYIITSHTSIRPDARPMQPFRCCGVFLMHPLFLSVRSFSSYS